ncbi:MAG: 2,3-diphosphoglycerate-dependent phosphoglycerate mutase [Ferrimicrobium sp.]
MGQLVLLRHGQSTWNLENRFTGWVDIDLTPKGRAEAIEVGGKLATLGLKPDIVMTSLLVRAIYTAELVLRELDRSWIPVLRSWRLNERHYGALQGLDKAETAALHGDEQVRLWRRSYDTPPPPLPTQAARELADDPRYAQVAPSDLPRSESLRDVLVRVLPFWDATIVPAIRADKTILVSAHGNSLRAIAKHVEAIPDDEIVQYEIANGQAIIYRFNDTLALEDKVTIQLGIPS